MREIREWGKKQYFLDNANIRENLPSPEGEKED
jgi:hypothetical protein